MYCHSVGEMFNMRIFKIGLSLIFSFSSLIVYAQTHTSVVKGTRLLDTNEVIYNEDGVALRYYQYTKLMNSGDYGIRLSGHPDDPQTKRFLKRLTVAEQMRMSEFVKTRMPAKSPILKEGMKLNVLPFLEVLSNEELEQKVKILIFWGAGCPPCTESFESINEVFRQVYNTEEVLTLAITRDSKEKAAEKLKEKPLLYAKLISNAANVYTAYNLNSTPTFVIADKNDVILFAVTGLGPQVITAFKTQLRTLLNQ